VDAFGCDAELTGGDGNDKLDGGTGADTFFGEPELEPSDLMRTDAQGRGVITLLELGDQAARPVMFSTFLMWVLADLFTALPEVGDVDKPKLVFMFDEAHLLFTDASKAFLEQVEQTVKLIRSKGVGVFFCTQLPTDVPNDVLSQLGARIQHALRAFTPDDQKALTKTVRAVGVTVWSMDRWEADDALATGAARWAGEVEQVRILTPDKDLGQCIVGKRVVQVDRKGHKIRNAAGVREKFGVEPGLIPDFLALVGDAADGYPGIPGIGAVTAARLLNQHGSIEHFPANVLGDSRALALLFKQLATLRTEAPLFRDVDELEWRGPTDGFAAYVPHLGDSRLLERSLQA